MNRAELKAIAHGFKQSRPAAALHVKGVPVYTDRETDRLEAWKHAVESVAQSLQLTDKPLSNFYAACGFIHRDTKETP